MSDDFVYHITNCSDAAEMAFKNGHFDYAINCAGETKIGQSEEVYEEGVYIVSVNCATAAAKHGVKRYVEISSGQMNSNEKVEHLFFYY